MNNFISKAALILLYPFIYLLHPRVRKANALRIKYWSMDKDFFYTERKAIFQSVIFGSVFYLGLVYAIPALVYAVSYTVNKTTDNIAFALKKANEQEGLPIDANIKNLIIVKPITNQEAELIVKKIVKKLEVKKDEESKMTQKERFEAIKQRFEDIDKK